VEIVRFIHYEDYLSYLKDNGYEQIGSGLFAKTFAKSGHNRVLKVYSGDSAYHTFIQRVKNLKNPYFPKVYSITKYNNKESGIWYAVELERLKHIEDLPMEEQEELLENYPVEWEDYFDSGCSNSEYLCFDDLIHDGLWGDDDVALSMACELIEKLFNDGVGEIDLHGRNVMVRKEPKGNRLIFTDPLFKYEPKAYA